MDSVAALGEFGLIDQLNQVIAQEGCCPAGLELGIGDDAALLRPRPGSDLAVTCDVLLEGRHFLPRMLHGAALGRRAMAVNLSDLAAMGASPRYAFVALGLRGDTPVSEVLEWYRGFAVELGLWQAGIAGGNMTRVDGPQFIAVTLMGEVAPGKALRRDGACAGDAVLVTGWPGQAAAGLQLLERGGVPLDHPLVQALLAPRARVAEGRALAAAGLVSAAIDLSDGLVADLGHLCTASGVGARLWAESLPLNPYLEWAGSELAVDPLAWVLGPSDDYELILTCPPEQARAVMACINALGQVGVRQVGELTENAGHLELVEATGSSRPLGTRGWDHFG
ncbi:MAG: thiamine-phosphate kinase [Candidatus Latescibacteria bacterium]|nr:thiamine-phosphate kinase [Candidatus Latescibacterota bacterium]